MRQDRAAEKHIGSDLAMELGFGHHEALDIRDGVQVFHVSRHGFVMLWLHRGAEAPAALEVACDLLGRDQMLDVVEHTHALTQHRRRLRRSTQLDQTLDAKFLIAAADLPAIARARPIAWHAALEHHDRSAVTQQRKRGREARET